MKNMLLLKIYLSGLIVLIGAILINSLAGLFGLTTWYDFLKSAGDSGFANAIRSLTAIQLVFLLVLYPAGLGLLVYAAVRVFKFFL